MSQPPDDHRAAFRATENPRVAFTAWWVDGAVGILYGRARLKRGRLTQVGLRLSTPHVGGLGWLGAGRVGEASCAI
jgi:hypothetical protein